MREGGQCEVQGSGRWGQWRSRALVGAGLGFPGQWEVQGFGRCRAWISGASMGGLQ